MFRIRKSCAGSGSAVPNGGFTLIEVVFALVILAVGLLALQGLGIGAVRSVAMGDQNSRAALAATRSLESALEQLSRYDLPTDPLPAQLCAKDPDGTTISRSVIVGTANPRLVRVSVRVTPGPVPQRVPPFAADAHFYSDQPVDANRISGSACPA